MNTYRKLTTDELKTMGINLACPPEVKKWVTKYFPKTANRVQVLLNMEYNDEGYDFRGCTPIVFDAEGNELVPSKGKSIEARNESSNWYSETLGLSSSSYDNECVSQLTFYLEEPELYVKI
jgi:hypothetical protein